MSIITKGYTSPRVITLGYGQVVAAIEEAITAILRGSTTKVESVDHTEEEMCVTVSLVSVNNKDVEPKLSKELCYKFKHEVKPRVYLKNIEVIQSQKETERIFIKVTSIKRKKDR